MVILEVLEKVFLFILELIFELENPREES